MEEPYDPQYPKSPQFLANFGPRNIIETKATTVDDATPTRAGGKVGKQTIVDGGPLRRIRTWIPRPSSAWKTSMTNWFAGPSTSSTVPPKTTSHSSFA